jgi:hypothetical protein
LFLNKKVSSHQDDCKENAECNQFAGLSCSKLDLKCACEPTKQWDKTKLSCELCALNYIRGKDADSCGLKLKIYYFSENQKCF